MTWRDKPSEIWALQCDTAYSRLQNDLAYIDCVGLGVKLYSLSLTSKSVL